MRRFIYHFLVTNSMKSVENIVIETEESEREYWERHGEEIAKVGLIHYPVPARQILSRLKQIGYDVESYSHLSEKKQKELLS